MKKLDLFIEISQLICDFKASVIEAKETNNPSRINHNLAWLIGEKVSEIETISPEQARYFDKMMDDIFKGRL